MKSMRTGSRRQDRQWDARALESYPKKNKVLKAGEIKGKKACMQSPLHTMREHDSWEWSTDKCLWHPVNKCD